MSVYNEPIHFIKVAAHSILNQTFKNFEFIIILDNPEYREASNFLNSLKRKYKNIRIIFNKRNLGLGPSLNKGIRIAKAPYIVRMDADDFSIKERLEILYNVYTANEKIDILSSNYCFFTEIKRKVYVWRYKKGNGNTLLVKYENFLEEDYPKHPTIFARKQIFLENPYILRTRSQDIDLFWRLKLKGFSFFRINKCLLLYRFPYLINKYEWKQYIKRQISFIDLHCYILKKYNIKNKCIKEIIKSFLLKKILSLRLDPLVGLYYLIFKKRFNIEFIGSFSWEEIFTKNQIFKNL